MAASVEPIKEEEKAVKACVVTQMESVLAQFSNVELSSEEEFSMMKMCTRLERILQDKEKPSEYNLSTINLWSKVPLLPSKSLDSLLGLCCLRRSNLLVVFSMEERKMKILTSEGHFIKFVTCEEADDGDLKHPSAIESLADGGFAVSDFTRVLLFDEGGKFIKTVWSNKDHDHSRLQLTKCFGLGQDGNERLVLLLGSRNETFLCILDSQKSEMYCVDVRDILKETLRSGNGGRKPNFKFLSVVGDSFILTDYDCGKVYVLKYSREGKVVKHTEIRSGKFLKRPAGVSADSQGNIIVADYERHKLCVFSDEGKWLKDIEVRFRKIKNLTLPSRHTL